MGSFLLEGLQAINHPNLEVITPIADEERGAQLSIRIRNADRTVFEKLTAGGVVADWREPDVIRVAPVALYNRFSELVDFLVLLKKCIE